MSDAVIYGFGLVHLILYASLGLSFVVYQAVRIIGGIAKLIWDHRDDIVPRFEAIGISRNGKSE